MLITLIKLVRHRKLKVNFFFTFIQVVHVIRSQVDVQYKFDFNRASLYSAQASCTKSCRCLASPARGLCETPYKGEYWCYVDPEACCEHKVISQRHKNLYWSNQPCNGVEISDINDLEERITDDGKLRCTEDSDCPPATPIQSSVCHLPRDLDGNLGEERLCFPG